MNKCIIVGAGEFYKEAFDRGEEDYIIAADGGYNHLIKTDCTPDLVIGDFDSIEFIPVHPNIIKLNTMKDQTDMAAAVDIAYNRGFREFHIYGGTGGRIDHTIANTQTIAYLSKLNCKAYLYGENYIITAVTDNILTFDEKYSGYISIFAHDTSVTGVTLRGLKYSLTNAAVTNKFPIGVSNEFTGEKSSVEVKSGTLLIIYKNQNLRR